MALASLWHELPLRNGNLFRYIQRKDSYAPSSPVGLLMALVERQQNGVILILDREELPWPENVPPNLFPLMDRPPTSYETLAEATKLRLYETCDVLLLPFSNGVPEIPEDWLIRANW
jgi:hypothetical protein